MTRYLKNWLYLIGVIKPKDVSVLRASLQYRVPVQTLRDRAKRNNNPHTLHLGSETAFILEEELILIETIEAMAELDYGHSNLQLQHLAGGK